MYTKIARQFLVLFIIMTLAFLGSACDQKSKNDAGKQPPPPAADPAKKMEKAAEKKAAVTPKPVENKDVVAEKKPVVAENTAPITKPEFRYEYDPRGKKDPFVAFKKPPPPVIPEYPLTNFEVKNLSLVGIIAGLVIPKGVIEAPDGKSYVVNPGTKIGRNDGTVVDILPDEVIIVEKKIDKNGNLKDEQISLKLRAAEEERGTNQ
jgi:type IV pilus assembly protein PilP